MFNLKSIFILLILGTYLKLCSYFCQGVDICLFSTFFNITSLWYAFVVFFPHFYFKISKSLFFLKKKCYMLKLKENLRASLILCSKFYIYILNWVVFSRRHWSYYHIILVCILHQHLLDFNFVENEANLKVLLPSATILYFSWSAENFLFAGGLCWSCQESQQLEGKIYINHRYSKNILVFRL